MSRPARYAVAATAVLLVSSLFVIVPIGHPSATVLDQAVTQTPVAIVGSVVDGALAPLSGVTITLESTSGSPLRSTSDGQGAFRFDAVVPGTYRLRAEHAGFVPIARDLRVPAGRATIALPLVLTKPGDQPAKYEEPARDAAGAIMGGARAPMPAPPPAAQSAPMGSTAQSGGAGGGRNGGGGRTVGAASPSAAASRVDTIEQEARRPYRHLPSGETYPHVDPNRFHRTVDDPLSTFGADVDTASYANVRRMLSIGQRPPRDAVRIEEFVNYFRFNYAAPTGSQPLALTTELGDCPWAPSHKLVLVGARARASAGRDLEGRNIVLLIDVSGSMAPPERLPLIKTALTMFVDTLQADDRIAIVTYAGTSGVALPSTPAHDREQIRRAIASLQAGGSTNGGSGLMLAYRLARQNYVPGGVNRVILATDGDFNVGVTSQDELLRLIEREKSSSVFLSVFGVGSGNLKDATMEMLADHGNGQYAYLDSLQEARRMLVREADSTLETVAKDVKFQVEFNPALVFAWKQIGYEDRALAAEDFNDDRKDGGELGAGHTVTALYEVVPVGADVEEVRDGDRPAVDPLKYQSPAAAPASRPRPTPASSGEWLTVKARFTLPEGDRSDVIAQSVRSGGRSQFLPVVAAVAEFGLLLRDDAHDRARWDALTQRVDRVTPPASLVAEWREFQELVAIAKGLW